MRLLIRAILFVISMVLSLIFFHHQIAVNPGQVQIQQPR